MKFLAVPGELVDPPNDDILYELQMHESTKSIRPLDMHISFTLNKGSFMAVVLHPMPGNVRDCMPKIDVTDTAYQHGLCIQGNRFPWNDGLSSSTSHTLRVVMGVAMTRSKRNGSTAHIHNARLL